MKKEKMQASILLNQNLGLQLNKDRIDHIRQLIDDYLRDGNNEISILNVAEASIAFKIFKEICLQNECGRKMVKTDKAERPSVTVIESPLQSLKRSKVGMQNSRAVSLFIF